MFTRCRAGVWGVVVSLAVALTFGAVPGVASTASEEQRGAALVKALNAGDRSCSSLSADDLESVGEYAMGLNFATVAQHDAMNAHMRSMMGTRGEQLAHQAMGRAYTGCGTSSQRSGAYGPGMMGGYGSGMMGGTPYGPGMMRGGASAGGAGASRLANATSGNGHDGWSAGAIIGVAVLGAMLAGGLVAVLVTRAGRHRPAAGAP